MSKRYSISERYDRLTQAHLRLTEAQAKLRDEIRKARNTERAKAGALVEKAGLLDLDRNALYGALRSLQPAIADKHQIELWDAEGARAFAEDAKRHCANKDLVRTKNPQPHATAQDATSTINPIQPETTPPSSPPAQSTTVLETPISQSLPVLAPKTTNRKKTKTPISAPKSPNGAPPDRPAARH